MARCLSFQVYLQARTIPKIVLPRQLHFATHGAGVACRNVLGNIRAGTENSKLSCAVYQALFVISRKETVLQLASVVAQPGGATLPYPGRHPQQ